MSTPAETLASCKAIVEAAEKAWQEATPGPWEIKHNLFEVHGIFGSGDAKVINHVPVRTPEQEATARLICAAHAAFPGWLAERKGNIVGIEADFASITPANRIWGEQKLATLTDRLAPVALALGVPGPEVEK